MNTSDWGERMVGTGQIAEQVQKLFRVFAQKHQLDQALPAADISQFRPATPRSGQLRLF
jgi:hypothetical protein